MKSKKPELTSEKEALILNAAQRRFITYGYSKVTMDEIAEDIGMGKASLYYYFQTKDDIFRSIMEREQGEFIRSMRELLATSTPSPARLRAYIELRADYSRHIFSLSWHNRQLWPSMKPMFKDLFEQLAREEEKVLTQLLKDGKQAKEFIIPSPEKVAQLIIHVLQGLRMRLFYTDQGGQSTDVVHQTLEKETVLFIETLLHGISPRQND